MERFKNYGLWLGIGSFVVLALETFGVDIDLGKYEQLYHALLSILVMAGILNNPSLGRGYSDKIDKKS
ncbi:holin [Anoxybacillus geothermalis]|uniref:holin n=1 Tax=Geobacillus TaxID=129337 RepID=UPI0005003396|nr:MULTISPECIES: holin [Geobacillus]MED0654420.1 holin [Anoxybacillus geothermalis]KFL15723.1 holin [Geobacillus stearothermophilus]KFX31889.1 holin [Geobacillus stearothermophilus]KZM58605.1 holin [Geobacillus stearothermophilus]MDF9296433.1 holin [Geobacillus stearothermophilus]